jgi:hypothetical protein
VAKQLGVYVTNIQIGDSVDEDVKNSFFVTMNHQLEIFAKHVKQVSSSRIMQMMP